MEPSSKYMFVAELQKFREKSARQRIAQKKYREKMKIINADKTDALRAEKSIISAEKRRAYQIDYAQKRRVAHNQLKEMAGIAKNRLVEKYMSGELHASTKDELIDMLMTKD